jgi:cation diffusion facilitator family transporter
VLAGACKIRRRANEHPEQHTTNIEFDIKVAKVDIVAAHSSNNIIVLALGANLAIACAKFAAFLWTGSSAMLSEAIHSVADTSNQGLLLYGTHRAKRPADAKHPFGYARELYFWSFVVAILLFSIGSGFSIYEGFRKLYHPHALSDPTVNYVVLIVAMALEGVALRAALREFNRRRGDAPAFQALRSSKDPALFTIVLEDMAAMLGLVIAFVGVGLAHMFDWPEADAIASIAIGLVLAMVATFIAVEVKALLIGEAAHESVQIGVRATIDDAASSRGHIVGINEIRTLQLGPNDVLVTASVDFDDTTRATHIKAATHSIETAIKAKFPEVTKFYIEVEAAEDHASMESDTTSVKPTDE